MRSEFRPGISVVPSGLTRLFGVNPRLKRWAIFGGPSGTGFGCAGRRIASALALAMAGMEICQGAASKGESGKIDFNRDVRPILTENCYKCHGPDDSARKAKLRLDVRSEALKPA